MQPLKARALSSIRVLSCFILVLIAFFVLHPTPAAAQDSDVKRQLYQSVLANPELMKLLGQIQKEPENQALMDTFLIKMPMSPIDFFVTAMESRFQEYAVPRHIQDLQDRWLKFHPEFSRKTGEPAIPEIPSAIFYVNPDLLPLAPVVGTNRDEAFTIGPTDYQGEIQIGVNKSNAQQLVDGANTWNACGANPNGTQDIFASTDSGTTWNYTCAPDVGAYTGLACAQPHFGSDPGIAWDNNNNAYVNYMLICCDSASCPNPSAAIVVAKSTNAGSTWSALGVVTGYAALNDKNFYTIDNTPTSPFFNRHYACWDLNHDERIAFSSNGGSAWTTVNTPKGTRTIDIGCDLAVSDAGNVYLTWDGLTCPFNCNGEDSYFSRSTNGGVSWSAPVTVVANKRAIAFSNQANPPSEDQRGINPFGAVDVNNNSASACYHNLYFAYTDLASGSNLTTANVYVKRSTDNGATWSTAVQVNDDASGASSTTTQFHPWLQVDQTDGSVIVGWHDTRHYSTNNRRMEAYIARSTNCGVNWEANIQVSQNSSEFNNNTVPYTDENSTDNANFNPNQYGEYLGVDTHNRMAYMAWCDSRQFYPTNVGTQKENVGFASITFCSAPTGFAAPTATPGCNGAAAKVDLSWSAPAGWGTNATGGTYSVERATNIAGPYTPLVTGQVGTTYTDNTAATSTTYFYHIIAKNNCPGTALTPMSTTSSSTSATTSPCTPTPPPVGDGWPGHAAGNPMLLTKSGNDIVATWDATTCNSSGALILYGNIGNFSGYAGGADCAAGNTGTKTFTPPAGDVWFNIVWDSGTIGGHPGYSTAGARTWSSIGLCSMLTDNIGDNVCN